MTQTRPSLPTCRFCSTRVTGLNSSFLAFNNRDFVFRSIFVLYCSAKETDFCPRNVSSSGSANKFALGAAVCSSLVHFALESVT